MSAFDDPRYNVLAMRAAAILGTTSQKIINAILAQWRCEIGSNDAYPPARNNPGNLSEDAAKAIGYAYTVPDLSTNPQPSNPIVTFATPEMGADAYGTLLHKLPRYAEVRGAIAADDPHAFFQAISTSGYGGGGVDCYESVYVDPIAGAPASIGAQPAGATGWVDATGLARIWFQDSAGVLRPIPYANGYRFKAWVGPEQNKKNAPGPKSAVITTTVFRKILSGVHINKWIRVSDMNTVFHDQ